MNPVHAKKASTIDLGWKLPPDLNTILCLSRPQRWQGNNMEKIIMGQSSLHFTTLKMICLNPSYLINPANHLLWEIRCMKKPFHYSLQLNCNVVSTRWKKNWQEHRINTFCIQKEHMWLDLGTGIPQYGMSFWPLLHKCPSVNLIMFPTSQKEPVPWSAEITLRHHSLL